MKRVVEKFRLIVVGKCKIIHSDKKGHNNLIDLNIIDDLCFIHNENNILYCNNCGESICNICIKSEKHKGHGINEIKALNLKYIKEKCIKFKFT